MASDTTKYLTAEGTASGSNVSWQAANNASSQIWRFVSGPALSQAGAVAWISNMIDKAAVDYPAGDSTQCVDLVKYYLNQYFGLSSLVSLGHGGVTYQGVVSKFPGSFTRIDAVVGKIALQAGDIVSMNGGESSYGHAALVESVSGNTVTFAEQYDGSGTVLRRTKTYPSGTLASSDYCYLYGVARPIF